MIVVMLSRKMGIIYAEEKGSCQPPTRTLWFLVAEFMCGDDG